MKAGMIIVLTMAIAGALAGLAGANQVLGVLGRASPGFSAGIGFDAIAVALLGRSHPGRSASCRACCSARSRPADGRCRYRRGSASTSSIIQALIIVFIAAPMLVRTVFPWAFQKTTGQRSGS
jgi:general nucleoside transport system permease protein